MNTVKYKALLSTIGLGSFSKAADELGYSQPNISHMIRDLEEEFGFPLLRRTRDGVTPTKDAEEVLDHLRHVVEQEAILEETIRSVQGIEKGTLRIGSFSSIAISLIPSVLNKFLKSHPGIDVSLMIGIRHELEGWLSDGSIDMAFMAGPAPDDCEFIHLMNDPVKALLPMDHPLAKQKAVRPAQLVKYPFVMPVKGGDEEVNQVFEGVDDKPEVRFTINNDNALFAMVSEGLGVSVMSMLPVSCSGIHNMAVLDLDPPQSIDMGIVIPSVRYASPSAREFIRMAQCKPEQ